MVCFSVCLGVFVCLFGGFLLGFGFFEGICIYSIIEMVQLNLVSSITQSVITIIDTCN